MWSAPVTLALCAIATAAVLVPALDGGDPKEAAEGRGHRIHRQGPMPPSWRAASNTDSTCWNPRAFERGFLSKLNQAREEAGKRRLRLDPELSKVARKHTREMTERNLLYHTSNDAMRRRVTFWSVLGENVGVGHTVDTLHVAFMNSPAHRDNIMYPTYRHVGIGTASASGRLWVTVVFQASENPGTTLRMPKC